MWAVIDFYILGGGISSDKYLEDLVTTPMRGIDNGEEWKLKAGIYWKRDRKLFTQSVIRQHLHLDGSVRNFPDSDRYKGLYEMADEYRDFLTDIDKLMLKYIGLANPEHINNTPIV